MKTPESSRVPQLVKSLICGDFSAIEPLCDALQEEHNTGVFGRLPQRAAVLRAIATLIESIPRELTEKEREELQKQMEDMSPGQMLSIPQGHTVVWDGEYSSQSHVEDAPLSVQTMIVDAGNTMRLKYRRFVNDLRRIFYFDLYDIRPELIRVDTILPLEERNKIGLEFLGNL